MGALNKNRVWLDGEFRAKACAQLLNHDSNVEGKRKEKVEVVKALASRFNNEALEKGCTPKRNPMLPSAFMPSSDEYIEPLSELLRRFDFMCEANKVTIPEDQRDDIYIELCRQFFTNVVNLEIKEAGARKQSEGSNVYKQRVTGVLLYGDKYAVGEQIYKKSSLRKVIGPDAWGGDSFLKEKGVLADAPYVLPTISYDG